MEYIVSFVVALIVLGCFYVTIKYHNSSFVTFVYHWEYRVLRQLRSNYLWGLKRTPPDSYDYFYNNAINYIDGYIAEHKGITETQHERLGKALDLVRMLDAQQYIHYYFDEDKAFTGAVFYEMWKDFRSGEYLTKDYFAYEALRKKMPPEIKLNEKAYDDFWKLVEAGWFDEITGMYILRDGRQKQHIGRAIKLICNRNNISSPQRVFSGLFKEKEQTIKGWTENNRNNEEITNSIDSQVKELLGTSAPLRR